MEAGSLIKRGTEAMRRWTGFLAGLGLLALLNVGCHHIAGICDCDSGCCGGHPDVGAVPVGASPAAAPVMPHAPVYHPMGTAASNPALEEDTVVPVTVQMPRPIVQRAE
jgi:hypothetical protein